MGVDRLLLFLGCRRCIVLEGAAIDKTSSPGKFDYDQDPLKLWSSLLNQIQICWLHYRQKWDSETKSFRMMCFISIVQLLQHNLGSRLTKRAPDIVVCLQIVNGSCVCFGNDRYAVSVVWIRIGKAGFADSSLHQFVGWERRSITPWIVSAWLFVIFIVVVVGLVSWRKSCRDSFRDKTEQKKRNFVDKSSSSGKRTTPGIPTWSPTVVLTGPDDA